MARPLRLPNFVAFPQEVCEISAPMSKIFAPGKKCTIVYQNLLIPATHQCLSLCQISLRFHTVCEISAVENFCSQKSVSFHQNPSKMICNDFLVVIVNCLSSVFNIMKSILLLRNVKNTTILEKKRLKVLTR